MSESKTEEMKVRVPPRMKKALQALAQHRMTSESAIARLALIEYLRTNAPMFLKDEPTNIPDRERAKRVSYGKKKQKKKPVDPFGSLPQ